MQKLFYLLFDGADADGTKLRDALCEQAVPALRKSGAREISVFAADADVEAGSPIRQTDPPIRAMVSFWLDDASEASEASARGAAEKALAAHVQGLAGYLVCESRPIAHERKAGERTPGMCQISCISKRPDISQEEFIRIWHGDHRQVAIETQSTFGYVRNEIFRALTPGAPDQWVAFVEEFFPMGALTDPLVFYAAKSQQEYEANFKTMMDSCARFLDHGPIEVTFLSEYYLG